MTEVKKTLILLSLSVPSLPLFFIHPMNIDFLLDPFTTAQPRLILTHKVSLVVIKGYLTVALRLSNRRHISNLKESSMRSLMQLVTDDLYSYQVGVVQFSFSL